MIERLQPNFVLVQVQYGQKSYARALRFYLIKSKNINLWRIPLIGIMIVAVAILSQLTGRLSLLNSAVLVFAFMVLLVDLLRYIFLPNRLFMSENQYGKLRSYRFSIEDFTIQDDIYAATFPWDFNKMWCTRENYYLISTDASYEMIPRMGFSCQEDMDLFEEIVQKANPGLKVKRFSASKR